MGTKAKKKLTTKKVQEAVNAAIRRRDGTCMVRDGRHPCNGILTASHFYAVGGNGSVRYYPGNIHAQCLGHHGIHERNQDPVFYHAWMLANHPDELEFIERARGRVLKYDQETLHTIKDLADADRLDELAAYIRGKLGLES
jgi:hypothetical protein